MMQEILDTIARMLEERTKQAEAEARAAILEEVLAVVDDAKNSFIMIDISAMEMYNRICSRLTALSPTPEDTP